ncbi:MAG: hypothetical protein V1798_01545 [Pseudomonadota bacterium]
MNIIEKITVSALAMTVVCCSGTALSPEDPIQAAAEFQAPSGSATDADIASIVNEALEGNVAGQEVAFVLFNYFSSREAKFAGCFSGDQNPTMGFPTNMDVKCLSDLGGFGGWQVDPEEIVEPCTGSGTVFAQRTGDFSKISISDLSASCPPNPYSLSAFNAEISATVGTGGNPGYLCSDLEFSMNDQSYSFKGCVTTSNTSDSQYLVQATGGNVVVTLKSVDASCATLCADIQDRNGTAKAVCDIHDKATTCNSSDDILSVLSCTLTRGASC